MKKIFLELFFSDICRYKLKISRHKEPINTSSKSSKIIKLGFKQKGYYIIKEEIDNNLIYVSLYIRELPHTYSDIIAIKYKKGYIVIILDHNNSYILKGRIEGEFINKKGKYTKSNKKLHLYAMDFIVCLKWNFNISTVVDEDEPYNLKESICYESEFDLNLNDLKKHKIVDDKKLKGFYIIRKSY